MTHLSDAGESGPPAPRSSGGALRQMETMVDLGATSFPKIPSNNTPNYKTRRGQASLPSLVHSLEGRAVARDRDVAHRCVGGDALGEAGEHRAVTDLEE